MNRLRIVIIIMLLVGAVFVTAQDKVFYSPAERSTPPVVVVKATVPDTSVICAEPLSGGLVACRPISEFRVWVREQPIKK